MAKQQALGNHSSLITSHSNIALGSKPKAISHLSLKTYHSSLKTHHFYLAVGFKSTAYSQNIAALSLAFLAMGCSPVLIFFKLCVVYLGAGRFFCALGSKPKAVDKRLRALCNNLLFAIGNLKQLVQFLVAGFSPVATKQINY